MVLSGWCQLLGRGALMAVPDLAKSPVSRYMM